MGRSFYPVLEVARHFGSSSLVVAVDLFASLFGVSSAAQHRRGGQNMNTIALPQTILKRLERISTGTRFTPQALVKQAVIDRLKYEEYKRAEITAAETDIKAGRVYGKEDFWAQLQKARNERKKAA